MKFTYIFFVALVVALVGEAVAAPGKEQADMVEGIVR